MSLVQLLYYSRPAHDLRLADVLEIERTAVSTNRSTHVTGYLLHTPSWFVQAIEGSPHAVNALYRRILTDPRHEDPVLLAYRTVPTRSFAPWGMGVCLYEQLREDFFLAYGPERHLDPRTMHPEAAMSMLERLARLAPRPQKQKTAPNQPVA